MTRSGTAAGGLVLPFILEALLSRYGAERTLQALVCAPSHRREIPLLTQIGVTLLQAVATFLLLGAALPLVRPRLPLPPKSQGDRDKKEESSRGAAVAGEAEAAKSVESPAAQPVTFKRMATNTRLLAFLAANSQSLAGGDGFSCASSC